MSDNSPLSKEMVSAPALWRLSLMIDVDRGVDVLARSTVDPSAMICSHVAFDGTLGVAKAFENAVYENPLLLADFAGIDIVLRTSRFTVVPADAGAEDVTAGSVCSLLWPDGECDPIWRRVDADSIVVAAADRSLLGFIDRTFAHVPVRPHISTLTSYFGAKSRLGNTGKAYVYLRTCDTDMVVYGDGAKVLLASTYPAPDDDTAAYYILAAARVSGFDFAAGEMMLCGDSARRARLMPVLRQYINYVMPAIFPSELVAAGNAAQHAPFELAILPLCE